MKIIGFRGFILRGLFWLLLPIALLLGGCEGAKPHRFRVTVNVEADGKIYSGSTIMEEKYYNCPPGWSSTCANHMTSRGEAIVVKVEGHGYLFLLQNYAYVGQFVRTQATVSPNYNEDFKIKETAFDSIGKWEIEDLKRMPFVTFTDIKVPMSVKEIIPVTYEYEDEVLNKTGNRIFENGIIKKETKVVKSNFEEYFGKGAKIKSIIVTPTNEPITWGQVEKVIPWIIGMKTTLDGSNIISSNDLANRLDRSFFIVGEPK